MNNETQSPRAGDGKPVGLTDEQWLKLRTAATGERLRRVHDEKKRADFLHWMRFAERALAAAPAAAPAWQPIETAPKDRGRLILLHGDGPAIKSCSMVGNWGDGGWRECWILSPGNTVFEPTHWMPLPAAPEIPCSATMADLDAWQCERCHGAGWHYVEREGVDPRDIVRTKEHCDECDGIGWCGPDAKIAAGMLPDSVAEVVFFDPASRVLPEKAGLIIDASLAFFDSAKIGDKLYSQTQMQAALNRSVAAIPAPEGADEREAFNAALARMPAWAPEYEQHKSWVNALLWFMWVDARAAQPAAIKPGLNPAPAEGDEQAAFEAWAARRGYHTNRSDKNPARYHAWLTNALWDGWQGCAASNVQPKGLAAAAQELSDFFWSQNLGHVPAHLVANLREALRGAPAQADANAALVAEMVAHLKGQAATQAPAPAPSAARLTQDGKLHVTAWQCHGCGHRGIDDGDDAAEACSDCNWRGPCPDEDVCPGCGREGTMVSACPKCGDRYYIKAEADIVIPTAAQAPAVGAGWQPIETAPKDHHRLVLLFGDGPAIQSCSMVGSWRDDGCSGCWVLSPGNEVFKPTHWMPLPAAPGTAVQTPPVAPIMPLAGWEFERDGDVIKVTAPDGIHWCVVRDDLAREDKIGAFFWALIDAIAAAAVATDWQPIETAPQDTHLLLAAEFDRPGDWRIRMGYFDSKSAKWAMWGASWKPTRWQPLPAAPGGRKE